MKILHEDVNNEEKLIDGILRALESRTASAMEEVVYRAAQLSENDGAALLHRRPEIMRHRREFASAYASYIKEKEIADARTFIIKGQEDAMSDFARRSYARVADMFQEVDFTNCENFVMVGCGPLPSTILHVHEMTANTRCVGLDVDAPALQLAMELKRCMGLDRFEVELCDGCSYDYANGQVIYIANLISGKAEVLERVAQTAAPCTPVVLRDPYALGEICSERGEAAVGSRMEVLGYGPPELHFLSRHVYLRTKARER